MDGAQNLSVCCESTPSTGYRTPEQFGQMPAIEKQTPATPASVELKSAFRYALRYLNLGLNRFFFEWKADEIR